MNAHHDLILPSLALVVSLLALASTFMGRR